MNIEKFKSKILDILRTSDLHTITSKSVRKLLQQDTSEPLDAYKKELNDLIMQCFQLVEEEKEEKEHVKKESSSSPSTPSTWNSTPTTNIIERKPKPTTSSSKPRTNKKRTTEVIDSEDEDGTTKKKKRKVPKKRNVDAATLQKNPFTKSWLLSSTLTDVTGEKALSRPAVVKALWKYIKEHSLQDPTNKTFIVCDDKLRRVFDGQDRIHCFTMNKFIGKHLSDLPADYVLDNELKDV
ncbi:SWIB/MDM2 domain-containing protein [Halteromyces radiatus]|uniref:SWIB/MDM2 domain-containing protein n=1 Tax=Halteromyces radiatus TaxID=101107 RepID=UPI00221FED6A|nr:SWIB/MDM2 domain-containing protein [Halteromyces radiatus]KAI8093354.1 SWIB/MDM2 domain-containing protein [Halteromyces radiatus]